MKSSIQLCGDHSWWDTELAWSLTCLAHTQWEATWGQDVERSTCWPLQLGPWVSSQGKFKKATEQRWLTWNHLELLLPPPSYWVEAEEVSEWASSWFGSCGRRRIRLRFGETLLSYPATWLILPVVTRSSQRLSHACVSLHTELWNCEWLIISVIVYLVVSYYLDTRSNSRANTCVNTRLLEGWYLLDWNQLASAV